jgi:hypothetical protein
VRRAGKVLRRYLLPGPGIHETGEVAGVGGSDHDIVVCVLVQDGGLGGEDDVGVERLVRGGGLPLFACVGLEARGEPHDLRGDWQVAEVPGELVEPAQAPGLAGPQEFPADLVIGDLRREHGYARREQGP